jgi:hypothetical protein
MGQARTLTLQAVDARRSMGRSSSRMAQGFSREAAWGNRYSIDFRKNLFEK